MLQWKFTSDSDLATNYEELKEVLTKRGFISYSAEPSQNKETSVWDSIALIPCRNCEGLEERKIDLFYLASWIKYTGAYIQAQGKVDRLDLTHWSFGSNMGRVVFWVKWYFGSVQFGSSELWFGWLQINQFRIGYDSDQVKLNIWIRVIRFKF